MGIPASTPTGFQPADAERVQNQADLNSVLAAFVNSILGVANGGTGNTTGNPSGTAGGDLGGTYPNPTVLSVADVTTGTLKIANGGTNSAAALSGHRTAVTNATAIVEAAAGTSGQLWQSAGSGADPAWAGETTWNAPLLLNSWVNFGGGQMTAGYLKDANGFVHLRGAVKSGTLPGAIFNLPAGYRPSAIINPVVASNSAAGTASVQVAGDVRAETGSNVSFILDGITFDTR